MIPRQAKRLLLPPACALALLAAAGPVAAHDDAPDEAAALGSSHAAAHAAQERALRRWGRLPAREQRRQTRIAERRSLAFEESLALPGPEVVGAWNPTAFPLQGYAINTVLLPTGKVLYWDRKPLVNGTRADGSRAYLWDPAKPTEPAKDVSPTPFDVDGDGQPEEVPLFCSGQSLLPTGEVFAAGGTLAQEGGGENWKGARFAMTFDPWTEKWTRQPDMRHGRWYPGQGQLADGRIVVVSGLDESGDYPGTMNADLEVFTPSPVRGGQGSWALYEASSIGSSYYPHLFTLPNGKMLLLGPYANDVALLDPAQLASGAWTNLPDLNELHLTGSAVLLPGAPSGSWRAAIVGGHPDADPSATATATAEVGDLSAQELTWQNLPDLNVPRSNANLVLLPDGSMVEVGGAAGVHGPAGQNFVGDPPDQRLKQVELYRPGAAQWELGPAQHKFRAYHSTALLLPDGRVLSAGDDYWDPNNTANPSYTVDIAELYSPPYLFQGTRPTIASAPQTLLIGERFRVDVTNRSATQAVLMAPGAVTHGDDMNQRHVELQVSSSDAGGINLVAPPSTAVAPPGWYMLFVLAADGTPSKAHWVQFKPQAWKPPPPPPEPTPTPTPTPTATPTPTPPAADTTAPKLKARLLRPARRRGPARLKITLDEAGSVRVTARAGNKRTRRTVSLRANRSRTVGVALPRRRRIRVTVSLMARDLAGNRSTRRLVKMLRR